MAISRINVMDSVGERSHLVARHRTALVRVGVVESNNTTDMTVNVRVGDAVFPAKSFAPVSPGAVVALVTDTDAWWVLGDLSGRKPRANEAVGTVNVAAGTAVNVVVNTVVTFTVPLVGTGVVHVFTSPNATAPAVIHATTTTRTLSGFTMHTARSDNTNSYSVSWHAIAEL